MQKVGALVGGSMGGPAGAAIGFTIGALIMGLGCILERTESNNQHAQTISNIQGEITRQDFILRRMNLICDRLRAQESVQLRHLQQLERIIERLGSEYDLAARENHALKMQIRGVERNIRRAYRQIENGQSSEFNVSSGPAFG